MRRYLLYVAHPDQVEEARKAIARIHAVPSQDRSHGDGYIIKPTSLTGIEIRLNLLEHIDTVIPHLRQFPVDLLIFDERQGNITAHQAITRLKKDIESLADLWGPDFHFPLGRMIAILKANEHSAETTFQLGRDGIRNVLVNPVNLNRVFRWIAKMLRDDLMRNPFKVGFALGGGGLEGFLFQLGCSYALEKALSNRSIYQCDVYSGISSGSLIASMLALKIPLQEVVASTYGKSTRLEKISAKTLYDIASFEIMSRFFKQSIQWAGIDPIKWVQKVVKAIPTGFFKGEQLQLYTQRAMEAFDKEDSFEALESELYIGATAQDSFEHVIFGEKPWDDIAISDAIRASCALPPVFTPMQIKDQNFLDGQITRTANLELTVNKGCNLIFIIDPMRPYSTFEPGFVEEEGGWFTLIQTIKTLVHTRFRMALTHLTERYPDVDFLVFQPYEECAQLMSGSPMKLRVKTKIVEMAYRGTLRRLRERHHVYATKLAKFGFLLASQRMLMEMEREGIQL